MVAVAELAHGESVRGVSGSMCYLSGDVSVKSTNEGGLWPAIRRLLGGGVSFFQTTYTADGPAKVYFAPPSLGDVEIVDIAEPHVFKSGSLLALDDSLITGSRFMGAASAIARSGAFMLEISGAGQAAISALGGIQKFTIKPGETFSVDTGHLLGFTDETQMRIQAIGGFFTSATSGENLIAHITGPSTVYTQTRKPALKSVFRSGGGPA